MNFYNKCPGTVFAECRRNYSNLYIEFYPDDGDSSLEEVEVADQSQETSLQEEDENEDSMNVSMKAMKLEDDVVNLSMEDLAKADTLDVCDVS